MLTAFVCPICKITFDSHESMRATGKLVDNHYKAKHLEVLMDPDRYLHGELGSDQYLGERE